MRLFVTFSVSSWLRLGHKGTDNACARLEIWGLRGLGVGLATKSGGWARLSRGKDGLLGNFLFLFGEVYGYVDVVWGFLVLASLLFAGPEEGPADRPEDEDDGQEEKDE